VKYSGFGTDSLTRNAVTHKLMESYGVSRKSAEVYLNKYDPDIMEVLKVKIGSDEWHEVFRKIVWGDMTDEEIQKVCQGESLEKLCEEVE